MRSASTIRLCSRQVRRESQDYGRAWISPLPPFWPATVMTDITNPPSVRTSSVRSLKGQCARRFASSAGSTGCASSRVQGVDGMCAQAIICLNVRTYIGSNFQAVERSSVLTSAVQISRKSDAPCAACGKGRGSRVLAGWPRHETLRGHTPTAAFWASAKCAEIGREV